MNENKTTKEKVSSEASRVKTSDSDVGVMSREGALPHNERHDMAAHLHDQILPSDPHAKTGPPAAGMIGQQGREGQLASEGRTGQTPTVDNGVSHAGSPGHSKMPSGAGTAGDETPVAVNIRPRYSKFLETTGKSKYS